MRLLEQFRVLQIFKINQLKLSSEIKSNYDEELISGHRIQTEKNSVNWSKEKKSSRLKKKWVGEWAEPGDLRKYSTIFKLALQKYGIAGCRSGVLEDLEGLKRFHSCCCLLSGGNLAGTFTRGLDSSPHGLSSTLFGLSQA